MLKLVGVRHLFIVPRNRSTGHLAMLAGAFPALCNSPPGDIQEPSLPNLRNLVVFDDKNNLHAELTTLNVRCAIDWREMLLWGQHYGLDDIQLHHGDVINLQFTRSALLMPYSTTDR
jgi:hypothetical protein